VLFKRYYASPDKKDLVHLNDIFEIKIDLKKSHDIFPIFFIMKALIFWEVFLCFFSSVGMLFTFDKEPLRLVFTIL
jgi:hypothetical protein